MAKSRICECCKREFLELDMRGTLCVCCYDFIEEYQDKENKVLEKALELACEEIIEDLTFESENDKHYTLQENIEYFKNMAIKEIMKSE